MMTRSIIVRGLHLMIDTIRVIYKREIIIKKKIRVRGALPKTRLWCSFPCAFVSCLHSFERSSRITIVWTIYLMLWLCCTQSTITWKAPSKITKTAASGWRYGTLRACFRLFIHRIYMHKKMLDAGAFGLSRNKLSCDWKLVCNYDVGSSRSWSPCLKR